MKLFILGLIGLAAQKGKASMATEMKMATSDFKTNTTTAPMEPVHIGVGTTEQETAPVLTNAMTDWAHALRLGVDSVKGVSNHHHARWLGLLGESFQRLEGQQEQALN